MIAFQKDKLVSTDSLDYSLISNWDEVSMELRGRYFYHCFEYLNNKIMFGGEDPGYGVLVENYDNIFENLIDKISYFFPDNPLFHSNLQSLLEEVIDSYVNNWEMYEVLFENRK